MKPQKLKINESQYKVLRESLEAQDKFLAEAVNHSKMMLEGVDAEVLSEGLIDSFKKVMAKGGFLNLKKAVMAAAAAGSLMGVSNDALAAAAQQAGASPEQAKEISMIPSQTKNDGGNTANPQTLQFAKELTKLNQRYVVVDGDQTKHFMKFTGNIADVVGIEPKNGYPIFAKGSPSEQKLEAAFKQADIKKGIVNVRGKDYPGTFIQNDGLWYTIQNSNATSNGSVVTPDPGAPATAPTAGKIADPQNTEIIDFTGLWQGAEQTYKENRAPNGTQMQAPKSYGSLEDYAAEFFRQSDPGFKSMSNDEIFNMFDHGLKAKVEKGKFKMGGKVRPALNPR